LVDGHRDTARSDKVFRFVVEGYMRCFKFSKGSLRQQRGASDVDLVVKLLLLGAVIAGIVTLQSCIKETKLKRMGYVEETYYED